MFTFFEIFGDSISSVNRNAMFFLDAFFFCELYFWSIWGCFSGAFGWSEITLKSFLMRSCGKRKILKKCRRVASKSRFAGSEIDAEMRSRSMLRPAKNTCSAYRGKTQMSDRFWGNFGTISGAKTDAKSHRKLSRKSISQKSTIRGLKSAPTTSAPCTIEHKNITCRTLIISNYLLIFSCNHYMFARPGN